MRQVAIFGATSGIAIETARCMALCGDGFFLVARDQKKLDALAQDLRARGAASVATATGDLSELSSLAGLFDSAKAALPALDTVLVAHGTLPDQKRCEQDFSMAEAEIRVNFLSAAALASHAANIFEKQGKGTIAVITSVAGDRGRQSNYVYGSAKGGLGIFLQGLRNRLAKSGVQVITIKPGFVDTPMTAGMKKGPLFASAAAVGSGIVKAIDKRRNVVYLPSFWWIIMTIIKLIPETIFKRLKL
jgi:short-subunit dehydrogenase